MVELRRFRVSGSIPNPASHPMCKLQAEAGQDRYDLKEEAWTGLKAKSKEGLSRIHARICKGPGA